MRLFLVFAVAVATGGFLGLFGGGQQISVSSSTVTARTVTVDRVFSNPVDRVKRLLLPSKVPPYGPFSSFTKEEMVVAAKQLVPYTRVPAHLLVGIVDQETRLGANQGGTGLALKKARNIKEQIVLDVLARQHGLGPDDLQVSNDSAFGLVHARSTYYLSHTGMEVSFGNTPTVLLHGTDQYRKMSRAEEVAGVKSIQRKLGLHGDAVDGVIGSRTLDAIQRVVGTRSFGRVAKYRLIKRFFAGEIKVNTSKKRDRVWQRICLAEGKDPRQTAYFMPNLWNPLHALAYASIHLEDDLRLARGDLGIALSAYFTGISDAKAGCKLGEGYKEEVVARSQKYLADLDLKRRRKS